MNNSRKGRIFTFFLIFMLCVLLGVAFICTTQILKMANDKNEPKEYITVATTNLEMEDISVEPIDVEPIKKIEVVLSNDTPNNISTQNNIIDNEILENIDSSNFYYSQLSEDSKNVYKYLEKNKENLKTGNYTIDFGETFNDLLHEEEGQNLISQNFQSAMSAFMYDNIDIFYIDITKMNFRILSTTRGSTTTYNTSIGNIDNSNYLSDEFNSTENVNNAISEVEEIKNTIVNSVQGMSDYEKVKKVHDILVNSLSYDVTLQKANIHSIYGALKNQEVVCDGYAKTFKYILDELNIPCILVTGIATNSEGESENHAWNYVKINETWYGVDVTWDDPLIDGKNNERTPVEYKYSYFLKGDEIFKKGYKPSDRFTNTDTLISYPQLTIDY